MPAPTSTASTALRRPWNSARSARPLIGPERPPTLARPSTVLIMLSITRGRSDAGTRRSHSPSSSTISATVPGSPAGSRRFSRTGSSAAAPGSWPACTSIAPA
ncbi:MAG: hypothetical protein ACLQBY_04350 [Solirubrobacteraceae bacterium]